MKKETLSQLLADSVSTVQHMNNPEEEPNLSLQLPKTIARSISHKKALEKVKFHTKEPEGGKGNHLEKYTIVEYVNLNIE